MSVPIQIAATLVRGDGLSKLESICETQKTVSTQRLEQELDHVREHMRLLGVDLSDWYRKQSDDLR